MAPPPSSSSSFPSSSSTSATPAATKRLLHELRSYTTTATSSSSSTSSITTQNPALAYLRPIRDENLFEWEAGLKGPEGSWYDGATFPLLIKIPPTYPLHPPILTFIHPYNSPTPSHSHSSPTRTPSPFPIHPNIHPTTGLLCLDLLTTAWSPAYTLSAVCTAAQQVLTSPGLESPLDVDVAVLLRGNRDGNVGGKGLGGGGDTVAVEGLVRLWAFGGGVG